MGIKIHNHYITDGYELSRKVVKKMKVKVRKKPVRKAERASSSDDVRIITETELRAAVKKLNDYYEKHCDFKQKATDCMLGEFIDRVLGV